MDARTPPSSGASEGSSSFRFPRNRRVRSGSEIRSILREGRRKRTSHLDVFFASNPTLGPRFGLVVPKHRRRVVERNRLRRRLRELGRVELLPSLEAQGVLMDVLIRARTEAYQAPFGVLQAEMREVAEALCSGRWSWP
ncbi:MAG: ribonuclease P protein component [Gemmatimonadota bacterium]